MKKRSKMTPKRSKKLFTRTAKRVHKKNAQGTSALMRGGNRL